jgi:C_GCAxxG_C_C family probable redox protein
MEELDQIKQLKQEGFYCSQIIMILGLDLLGKQNPELVASMQGLAGGLGFCGEVCGALTGGVCLLSLYAGKSASDQPEDPRLLFMIEDLVKWFKDGYGKEFGGIRCDEIIGDHAGNMLSRCPLMVSGTYQKVKELLVENGFDLSGVV